MPSPFVAAEGPPVLSLSSSLGVMRGNHLDAECGQLRIEIVAVVRPVSDESFWKGFDEAGFQGVEDVSRFMSLTTRNQTHIIGFIPEDLERPGPVVCQNSVPKTGRLPSGL